jgi:hypothetical protein
MSLKVMNYFSFCLSWNVFISSSVIKDTFAGYSNLGWHFLSALKIHNSMISSLLVSIEKIADILMGLPV